MDQVLRWSALLFGIGYGFQHQRTITSNVSSAHADKEWRKKEDLIQKAKLEWAKKTMPPQSKTASGDGMLLRDICNNGISVPDLLPGSS